MSLIASQEGTQNKGPSHFSSHYNIHVFAVAIWNEERPNDQHQSKDAVAVCVCAVQAMPPGARGDFLSHKCRMFVPVGSFWLAWHEVTPQSPFVAAISLMCLVCLGLYIEPSGKTMSMNAGTLKKILPSWLDQPSGSELKQRQLGLCDVQSTAVS